MGAGARRRGLRRAAVDAAEAREAARFWVERAEAWAGPSRGRGVEQDSDARWAREMASASTRAAMLLETGPGSLRDLGRLVRAQGEISAMIAAAVGRLRDAGASWAQIAAELGITAEGARKRFGS